MTIAASQSRIRLLWLIDSLNVGGAETLAIAFARRYDRERYDLTIAYLQSIAGSAIQQQLQDEGVTLVPLHARNLRDLAAFRRLLRLIREARIDVVHAHLTYSAIWSALASRLTGVPSLATLHVAPPQGGDRSSVRDRLMRFAVSRWTTLAVMVSDALKRDYTRAGGLAVKKMRTVHNGIELARFARDKAECRARIEREFAVPAGVALVATVSVLREGKGIEVLLQAARDVPAAHFLIIGDGAKRAEWAALADSLGLAERIHWAGHRSDVYNLLAGCDLLVHPSLADALPTVLMEAMAAGLPVVATDVGGIPEIVEEGRTGTLVPPGDAAALSAAINGLLGDGSRLALFAQHAPQSAAKFSTEAWIARLETVYQEALGERT
jgi:glycosyltransferase involved in cell wall biosynthesis